MKDFIMATAQDTKFEIWGEIGERTCMTWLIENEKLSVCKTEVLNSERLERPISILNEKGIEKFLHNYTEKNKVLNMLKQIRIGLPDFICLKDNVVSFVEVKTNESELSYEQTIAINKIKEAGYDVKVKRYFVDYTAEEIEKVDSKILAKKFRQSIDVVRKKYGVEKGF